jgi:hypothetical protein
VTSKRERRARRGGTRSPAASTDTPAEAAPGPREVSATTVPPMPTSVARGLLAVTAAPITLGWTFLSLLVTWGVFVALGEPPTPPILVALMSLSPAHLLVDLPVAFGAGEGVAILMALALLGVVRAVTFGVMIELIDGWLRDGRPDPRRAIRGLPSAMSGLFTAYLIEVAAMYALLAIASQFLGQLAPLATAAALYFLAYVPVVAVVDGGSLQTIFRRGFRAARLPGTRHLTLVMVYFLVFFYAASVTPFSFATPSTPGPLVWAFALVVTLFHAGVMGALVYRWRSVRDLVPREPSPRRRPS